MQCGRDITDRQTEAVEAHRIDRNAHLLHPRTKLTDAGDALRAQQFGQDVIVNDRGQRGFVVATARHGQLQDRSRVFVGLDDAHLLDAIGQVVGHSAHGLAHVGRCGVQINAGGEFDADAATILLA